ncbi:g7007 [Coccomyxa viridis]|uniref:G7007 protein n=1 Tax=Coccomyxa viridis TaxID=1274662 RepID=A0ABP1FWQ6_9CHLO
MGVKGFNTWFGKTFPQAYVPVKRQVDHLYLDMASFLHEELRKAKDQDSFHYLLHKRLDAVLRLCEPQKTVTFALDGPAPVAKLITQRERRRKEQQKQERTGLKALSSLGLTPGTSLMALIQQSLAFYICRRLESERWQHVQWELSGANVQGEGEVKILSRVLRPWAEVTPDDTHAIVALDSDMALMALMMPNPNVYVLAEPARPPRTPNKKGKVVRRLKSARPMFRGYTCFSPAALHRHWYKDHPFLRGPTPEDTGLRMSNLKRDLVLLAVLSAGNDYLPSLGAGSQKSSFGLWTKYLKLKTSSPSWASRSLTKLEGGVAVLNKPALADFLRTVPGNSRVVRVRDQGSRPAGNAKQYMEGLDWLLRMYTVGACPDYRWTYDACSPSATQLVAELDSAARLVKAGTDVPQLGAEEDPVTRETGALLPTVCAMALLPAGPAGQAYAPAALRHLMTDPDSPVADLYQSCSVCEGLRKAESMATLALVEARERMYVAEELKRSKAVTAARAHASELEAAVAKSDAEAAAGAFQQLKDNVNGMLLELRQATLKRSDHVLEAHPYRAFPVDRLEAAVKAIPLESFPVVERELATFGSPHRFWRGKDAGEESNSASGAFALPEAPASSMSSIAEHSQIGRETLAEEYGLLHLPPLAITPGEPRNAVEEPRERQDSEEAADEVQDASGAHAAESSEQATPEKQSGAPAPGTMQQLLRFRTRAKAGVSQRHISSVKKRMRQSHKRQHAESNRPAAAESSSASAQAAAPADAASKADSGFLDLSMQLSMQSPPQH